MNTKASLLTLLLTSLLVAQSGFSLMHQSSSKGIVKGNSPTSVSRNRAPIASNVKIYAMRVEFQPDLDDNTTGNGLFLRESKDAHEQVAPINNDDVQEFKWYADNKTYPYDNLPHDATYLSQHLDFLVSYYDDVSNGAIQIEYELYPEVTDTVFQVPLRMALYSTGKKKDDETYEAYYLKRTEGLMRFVRDAIIEFDTASSVASPFSNLIMDDEGHLFEVDSTTGDSTLVVLLVMHAGSSNLIGRSTGNTSPSDLQDIFINSEHFFYFKDIFNTAVVDTPVVGVKVNGKEDDIVISELMMVSETSNQDSTNWGINGILVNQFARQIGLPDLQNNFSGGSGVGGFCILDVAGYSRAQGFIPPYPSAWTRMYAGWDTPVTVESADSLIIDAVGTNTGTSIYKIPINQYEYWLVENRQRNLTSEDLFIKDTTEGVVHDRGGAFSVDLSEAVDSVTPNRGVVISVKSRDVGIPASGGLVWHIDERIIDDRFDINAVNGDLVIRGVALEEADGIVDIGYSFQYYDGSEYSDYGGGEDVFPHRASHSANTTVTTMRSDTRPSTRANDGGHSFKTLTIAPPASAILAEKYAYAQNENTKYSRYFVENYRTQTLYLSVAQELDLPTPVSGWPTTLSDSGFYDPLYHKQHLYVLDQMGQLFIIDSSGSVTDSSATYLRADGKEVSLSYSLENTYTFPTLIGEHITIPTADTLLYMISEGSTPASITLQDTASSNVVGFSDSSWFVGMKSGAVTYGEGTTVQGNFTLDSSAIIRLAQFGTEGTDILFCAVTEQGNVIIFDTNSVLSQYDLNEETAEEITLPFTLTVGDLNGDNATEVIVTDARQGLWLLQASSDGEELYPHPDAIGFPNTWAGYFRFDTTHTSIPMNGASPTLSDINGDGNIEILLPGTNGIYAFNHTGVLLEGWPAQMDRPEWYVRKSILSSPITVLNGQNEPFMLMASPTGDATSYYITKADSIDTVDNIIYFIDYLNQLDSLENQSQGFIDSTIDSPDSSIGILFGPGGLIDGRSSDGTRPVELQKTANSGTIEYSTWPLTAGGPISTAPLAIAHTSGTRLFALSDDGTVYQWHFDSTLIKIDPNGWAMTGGSSQRTFYRPPASGLSGSGNSLSSFYSYPNPVKLNNGYSPTVRFRYELEDEASSVELSIYSMNGHLLFSEDDLPTYAGLNEYTLERLDRYGSAVYQCRLAVTINDKETVRYWKMVVLRGAQK